MDSETIKLLIATCSGPAIMTMIAGAGGAIWYVLKMRATGQEKREDAGYSYTLAKDQSMRAFGEGVKTREAEQLNEITSAALKQIYTLTDGTLTRIRDNIEAGNIEQAIQDAKILSEMAAQFAIVIASLNKTIEQQARILAALLELLGRASGTDILSGLTKEVLAGLTTASITSQPFKDAAGVATAATDTHPTPAGGLTEGEKVATIAVSGKEIKGESGE